jgi:putative transferase (TIGR04331 family)
MGWTAQNIPNLVRGASLFPFVIDREEQKKYHMLIVNYDCNARMPHYGGNYGLSEVNSPLHLEFMRTFMSQLNIETLKKTFYRSTPKFNFEVLHYDMEDYLKEFLQYTQKTPAVYAKGETCKEQMLRSRLVVINYISTSYLEAMLMNIPVVFFFNPATNYLEEEYADFFQPLIEAGICQTDPVKAAQFVERIFDNPEAWWQQEEVQRKKNEWLAKNFQKPQVMIDYMLNLLN